MDTRLFWNKVDFSETIQELKEEQKLLKRRRSSFENEISISEKKIKIDNNDFLEN